MLIRMVEGEMKLWRVDYDDRTPHYFASSRVEVSDDGDLKFFHQDNTFAVFRAGDWKSLVHIGEVSI